MDQHVVVRSIKKRFFSFAPGKFIYFTDAPSLNVTFYEYPYLEDNNITSRCMPVAGQFNIGKWFRSSEFAFYLKSGVDTFKVERGEIYSYMRFHTDEKINFVQFRYTKNLDEFQKEGFALTHLKLRKLETYYSMFKNKKKILYPFLVLENEDSKFDWDSVELKCNSNVPENIGGFPEMDGYKWVTLDEAEKLIHETQVRCLPKIKEIIEQ